VRSTTLQPTSFIRLKRPARASDHSWARMLLMGLLGMPAIAGAGAAGVQVSFDASPIVACRDVSTEEFLVEYPGEQLLEARLDISMLVPSGSRTGVAECQYQFHAPERRLVVDSFLPRTTLASDVVGNINVQQSKGVALDQQLSIGGRYESIVKGELELGGRSNKSAAYDYQLLPRREILTASGTVARGSGVYFKLRQTPQTTLEGSHEFVLFFRVPTSWRADYLRAVCQARSQEGKICGQTSFLIPLYIHGDTRARSMAAELRDYEQQLIATASQYRHAVRRASRPTFAHELSLIQPNIPATWLSQVVTSPATQAESFESSLPSAVRAAIGSYRQAKKALAALPPEQRLTQVGT